MCIATSVGLGFLSARVSLQGLVAFQALRGGVCYAQTVAGGSIIDLEFEI